MPRCEAKVQVDLKDDLIAASAQFHQERLAQIHQSAVDAAYRHELVTTRQAWVDYQVTRWWGLLRSHIPEDLAHLMAWL